MSADELLPIEQFAQIYADRTELAARAEADPDNTLLNDLLRKGIAAADARAAELAEREAALRDHYGVIGRGPVEQMAELEQVTPIFERLKMTDELETLRAKVAAQLHSPEMPVAQYYMTITGDEPLELPTTTPASPAVSATPVSKKSKPAATAEAGEAAKPQLTILIDPNNNISVNGRRYSLSRELHMSRSSQSEAEGRALRADILIFLANNSGQMFRAGEIWHAIRPGVIDRQIWKRYGQSLLTEGIIFNRKSIITAQKQHEKLYVFGIMDYDVNITRIDRRLKINDNVYTLPDGQEVAGRVGQVLWLLHRASADKPLGTEQVMKLLSPEERATVNTKEVLSGYVAQARSVLRERGVNLAVQRVLLDEKDPDSGRRRLGYYLKKMTKAQLEKARVDQSSEATASSPETQEEEEALSLHEATVLAAFLNFYGDILREHGLEPVPDEMFQALNQKVIQTYTNGEKDTQELSVLRTRAFEKVMALLDDSELLNSCAERIEAGDMDDPRVDLLLHLLEGYNKPESMSFIKDLLQAHPEVVVKFDGGRRRGFVIVDVSIHKAVGRHGRPI